MITKLNVYYNPEKWIEGFRFVDYKNTTGWVYLGEIEIDNPFEVPSLTAINAQKVVLIDAEIKEHLAKVYVLENAKKDLLCLEYSAADEVEEELEDEQESDNTCNTCNGTGEGSHDGTRCWSCNGSGVLK